MPIFTIRAVHSQQNTRLQLEAQTLREARSEGRAKSKNPNTLLEIRAEEIVDKILTACGSNSRHRHHNHQQHHAEAQRPVLRVEAVAAVAGPNNNYVVRPDIVIRDARSGRAVAVIDAKNYVAGTPLPLCQVEKLVRDMRAVGAPYGILFVAKSTRIGPKTVEYAAVNNVKIVRDGKNALREMEDAIQVYRCEKGSLSSKVKEMLRAALGKVSLQASASGAAHSPTTSATTNFKPLPLPPSAVRLKKDGSPDMRFSANRTALVSTAPADARGPLKKDGTPDLRYKANRDQLI
ncbi:hypothetical protein HDU87_003057 [Geranomyces variabilis]|uniref:Uncharacterized protein n=1 Tax=Geranomyces variabilis TaxID=109894 RepID=A0AAD5XQT5_9FUNG|nr:hypothetical protein HDU87_003057 [Geranomyces variabilis]